MENEAFPKVSTEWWPVAGGQREFRSDKLKTENGKWKMENAKWKIILCPFAAHRSLFTVLDLLVCDSIMKSKAG
jgi:hypothetical protein